MHDPYLADLDRLAGEIQRAMESYALRYSIDGRRRVLAEALRKAFAEVESYRRGLHQSNLIRALPLPREVEDELAALREVVETMPACRVCNNTGKWYGSCRFCTGDSTFEHECELREYVCDHQRCAAHLAALTKLDALKAVPR